MEKENLKTPDFLGITEKLKADIRTYAKVYCLQWFDDSFQNEDESSITFGTHVPYAAVHNFGLRVRGIQYVRTHYRTSKAGKRYQVQNHARKIDRQNKQGLPHKWHKNRNACRKQKSYSQIWNIEQ